MYNQFNSYNFNNDMYDNLSKIRYMEKNQKIYLSAVDISKLMTNNISYLTSRYKTLINTKYKYENMIKDNPEISDLLQDIEFLKIPLSNKNKSYKRVRNSKFLKMFSIDLIILLLTGSYKDRQYKIYRMKNESEVNTKKELLIELLKSDNLIKTLEDIKEKGKDNIIRVSSEEQFNGLAKLNSEIKELLLNEDRKFTYEEVFFKLIVDNNKIGKITYNQDGINYTYYSIIDICRLFNLSDTYRIGRCKKINDYNYISLAVKKHGGKKTLFLNIEGLCEFFEKEKGTRDYHASISGELTRLLYILCLRNKDNPLFI